MGDRPFTKSKNLLRFLVVILSMPSLSTISWAQESSIDAVGDKTLMFFGGYNGYSMEDFNEKLKQEGNKTIKGGFNAGVEVSPYTVSIPGFNIPIRVPVYGIEYLDTSSKTTHADTLGSATVNWNLPVIGGYITADIPISDKVTSFYLRPISLGLYHFGDLFDAGLTVSDRPGRLDASGTAIGISTGVQFRHRLVENSPFFIFLTGSYRWLKFTNVKLTPQGGFTVTSGGALVQPSTLPESLDYGGGTFRGGMGAEF